MPCCYVIDKERRLVISIGWGRINFGDMKAHQDSLLADPDFNPEFNQLLDGREVEAADVSGEEMKLIVRRKVFSRDSRRAWVAKEPSVYGIGRMGMAYLEMSDNPGNLCAFYDIEPALKWLGVESLPEVLNSDSVKTKAATLGKRIG